MLKNMRALLAALLGLSLCASNGLGQSTPASTSPVVADVLRLSQAKVDENIIIEFVHNSPGVHLTASEIIDLRAQGLSSGVLVALMNAQPGSPAAAQPPPSAPAMAQAEPAPAQTELVAAAPSYTSDPVVLAAPEPVYYDFSAPYYPPYSYAPYYDDLSFGFGLGWGLGWGFAGCWGWGGWGKMH